MGGSFEQTKVDRRRSIRERDGQTGQTPRKHRGHVASAANAAACSNDDQPTNHAARQLGAVGLQWNRSHHVRVSTLPASLSLSLSLSVRHSSRRVVASFTNAKSKQLPLGVGARLLNVVNGSVPGGDLAAASGWLRPCLKDGLLACLHPSVPVRFVLAAPVVHPL